MTSEEKVKQLWPDAFIEQVKKPGRQSRAIYRVTIKPGRYVYGKEQSWAWKNAWAVIVMDEELRKGRGPEQGGR